MVVKVLEYFRTVIVKNDLFIPITANEPKTKSTVSV